MGLSPSRRRSTCKGDRVQSLKPKLTALITLLLLSQLAAAAPPTRRPPPKQTPQFLRLTRDKSNAPLALETAIMRLAPAAGAPTPTVDLVAAVHIADPAYFRQLNRELQAYDAVLYELVAPEEMKTPKPGDRPSNNPISAMQNGMKDLLDLEFQLKGIDYTQKNMVHADMSPEQFAKSMQDRGESAWTMLGRMLAYAIAKENQSNDISGGELFAALFAKNRALSLKRLLAEQFQQSEGALAAMEGPNGSTLISGRNKVATDVLRKEIAAGRKKLAIFYGAGHMPDFQKRLHDDFAMKPVNTRWLTAWNLKAAPKPPAKPVKRP
jgi:hypothetical protein